MKDSLLLQKEKYPCQVNDVCAVYHGAWLNDQVTACPEGKHIIIFIYTSDFTPEYIGYWLCFMLAERSGPEKVNTALKLTHL